MWLACFKSAMYFRGHLNPFNVCKLCIIKLKYKCHRASVQWMGTMPSWQNWGPPLLPTASVNGRIPLTLKLAEPQVNGSHWLWMGRSLNALWVRPFCRLRALWHKVEKVQLFKQRRPTRSSFVNTRKYTVQWNRPLWYNPGKHMDTSKSPHPSTDASSLNKTSGNTHRFASMYCR